MLSTHQRETAMHAVGRFRSLLVPLDLTAISDRVLARVALLPLAVWARVTLLHVIPNDPSVRALERAERDAKRALADEARHLARALPKHVGIELVVKRGSITAEIAKC